MPAKLPWMKFYPDKWLSDEKLRACGYAAKGLWTDIIALSCKNDRRGYLQLNGKPLSPERIARMTGGSADEVTLLLQELKDAGVPSVTPEGILFCRHIVRETGKSEKCSVAGKRGVKQKTLKGQRKGEVKGQGKGTLKGASILSTLTSELLKDKGFNDAFKRYLEHRRDINKPLTMQGAELLVKRLEPHGVSVAIAALNQSVESGWQGVFVEKVGASHGKTGFGNVAKNPHALRSEEQRRQLEALSARAKVVRPAGDSDVGEGSGEAESGAGAGES